jgi:hypothetical protein
MDLSQAGAHLLDGDQRQGGLLSIRQRADTRSHRLQIQLKLLWADQGQFRVGRRRLRDRSEPTRQIRLDFLLIQQGQVIRCGRRGGMRAIALLAQVLRHLVEVHQRQLG